VGCAAVEVVADPREIAVEIGIISDHIAYRQTVAMLDQILLVDHPGSVFGHSQVGEPGRTAGNDEGAAMAISKRRPFRMFDGHFSLSSRLCP
jgi:hypothetical protein